MTAFKTLITLLFTFALIAQSVTALVARVSTNAVADAVNVIRSKNGLKPVNDNP